MSEYIQGLVEESKRQAEKEHPQELKKFFEAFHRCLTDKCNTGYSQGDRQILPGVVGKALQCFLPDIALKTEVKLREFLAPEKFRAHKHGEALERLLNEKRVDLMLERGSKRLLIEFKTPLEFNSLTAAMVEMAAAKMFAAPQWNDNLFTASLHLIPNYKNIAGLRALNEALAIPPEIGEEKKRFPLDFIWILCDEEHKFIAEAFGKLRDDIDGCLGAK